MKKGFQKILISLAIGTMALSGCSLFPKRSSHYSQDVGVGESVPPYGGNQDSQIGTLPNTPVSSYKEETLRKIRNMSNTIFGSGEEYFNNFVDCMLSLKIGDNLACSICDTFEKYANVNIYNNDNYMKEYSNFYYETLTILNSLDFNAIADFMDTFNDIYNRSMQGDYESRTYTTLLEYFNPSFGSNALSYRQYAYLKKHQNQLNNSELNSLLSQYDNVFDSVNFTNKQKAEFNDYKNRQSGQDTNYYYFFPRTFVNFVRKHAGQKKDLIVEKLKLIVDATTELSSTINGYFEKTGMIRTKGYGSLEISIENYGTRYFYNDTYIRDENDLKDLTQMILEKRPVLLGLAKAIVGDNRMGDLLIDTMLDLYIPLLEESLPSSDHNKRVFSNLKTKIKALNGNHISALATFVINLLNQVYDEDIVNFVLANYHGDGNYFNTFGDKYIGKLQEAVSSISATDKALINEMMAIFNIDLFEEIQNFINIFKNKNLDNEQGQEQYYNALSSWWINIVDKIRNEVTLESTSSSDSQLQNNRNINIRYEQSLSRGGTLEESYIYIIYNEEVYSPEYGGYISLHVESSYIDWNNMIDNYAREYENILRYYPEEANTYHCIQYRLLSELAISNFTVSNVDTSNYGYTDVTYSFNIKGEAIRLESYILVGADGDLPKVVTNNACDFYGSGNYYSHDDDFRTFITDLNGDAQMRCYYGDSIYVDLDTSKKGWNCYINDVYSTGYDYSTGQEVRTSLCKVVFVYYIIDKATLINDSSVQNIRYAYDGVILEGADGFIRDPELNIEYKIDGLRFMVYYRLPFDQKLVNGKQANQKYSVTYEGITYDYVIIKKENGQILNVAFRIDAEFNKDIINPISVNAQVTCDIIYTADIDGRVYKTSTYENFGIQQLSNLTYINGVISFTYNGQVYSFNVGDLSSYYRY